MNLLRLLRIIGYLEGLSFIALLGVCMPLKYLLNTPEPTKFVGMFHGFMFMAYCLLVIQVRKEMKWSVKQFAGAMVASIIPFGTFIADKKLFNQVS